MRQLRVEQGAAPQSKPGRYPAYGHAFLAFGPEIWGRQSRLRLVQLFYKFAIDYGLLLAMGRHGVTGE